MSIAYKALFLDLSGVVYEGNTLVKGADGAVRRAREQGITLRFVTNTATKSRNQILEKLHDLGVPLEEDELFTAPMAALALIRKRGWTAHCLLHENLRPDFEEVSGSDPDCVVLGDARDDLNYASLNQGFRLCKQGAPLIAIGCNKYFKDEHGLNLDAGAFVRAVEWAADVEAIIAGKPGKAFFEEVVASTPHAAGECIMVGDDPAADVAAAMEAGLRGCQVRTGKYQPGDEDTLPDGAQVIDSIADLEIPD